jgi:hypothetical protein
MSQQKIQYAESADSVLPLFVSGENFRVLGANRKEKRFIPFW